MRLAARRAANHDGGHLPAEGTSFPPGRSGRPGCGGGPPASTVGKGHPRPQCPDHHVLR
jgi:hypothetical protein